jgi:hypothetical protein
MRGYELTELAQHNFQWRGWDLALLLGSPATVGMN